MTGKRILLAGIPVLAFAALIGGGFATWYFTTSDQVSEKIGVTITDESEIGEITVLNADDIFLSLDQNVHQLSEPLQVRFTPVDELVSDVAPDVSSFEFSYHLEFENEDRFREYLDFQNDGTWNDGEFTQIDNKWVYQAEINPTFTLVKVFTSVSQFNVVKAAVIQPCSFTIYAELAG